MTLYAFDKEDRRTARQEHEIPQAPDAIVTKGQACRDLMYIYNH